MTAWLSLWERWHGLWRCVWDLLGWQAAGGVGPYKVYGNRIIVNFQLSITMGIATHLRCSQ